MKVAIKTMPNGTTIGTTTLRVNGGTITVRAEVTRAELRRMIANAPDSVGFKLSFKSLGRAVKAMAKPATLLKVTSLAARIAMNPAAAITLGPQVVNEVKRGMAAKRVLAASNAGNPQAQEVVRRAQAAAETGGGAAFPGIDQGVMRYLVTLERLKQLPSDAQAN
jgi:hypothetical protein